MSFENQTQRRAISILSTVAKEIKKRVLKKNAAGKNQHYFYLDILEHSTRDIT